MGAPVAPITSMDPAMRHDDTIMALSSGVLPAGVAVIRLSGPKVRDALMAVSGPLPKPRLMALRHIGDAGQRLDQGLVVFFPGPASFTGEDCAELHVHGSRAGVKAILAALSGQGLRLAEAGEFTRRAFENGKLDLLTVEGLGDLLAADTERQRQQALARYDGALSAKVEQWRSVLLDLRAELEARLDFSDEGDVDAELPDSFLDSLVGLRRSIADTLAAVESGRVVREGIRVALAGAPNAGKSSLINALAKSDIAIVSDEAGTTRDVREGPLDIDGNLFVFLDLAGLRNTDNKAEAEGIRRAKQAMEGADIVLWLMAPDTQDATLPGDLTGKIIRVATKSDLTAATAPHDLQLSAVSGEGLDMLFATLARYAEDLIGGEPALVSHERDRMALSAAVADIDGAGATLKQFELAAESLREASASLERLIGKLDAERVLDRLFLQFCIGK